MSRVGTTQIAVCRFRMTRKRLTITTTGGEYYTESVSALTLNGDVVQGLTASTALTRAGDGAASTVGSLLDASWNDGDTSGEFMLVRLNDGAEGNYTLGQEDYVTLPFSASEPIYFNIGDYADLSPVLDTAQGKQFAKRYEVCEFPKPTLNASTGGYDYELRLDAYYMKWKNKIFRYIPTEVTLGCEAQGEASWNLTATLGTHLDVLLRNLTSLGYTYGGTEFAWEIDPEYVDTGKARLCSYSEVNIIDALTQMAETFGCEWWVTDNVIHMGRCETVSSAEGTVEDDATVREGGYIQVQAGVEAETVSRSDSAGQYATRIYAFGAERNIQPDYRSTADEVLVNGVVQRRLMLPEDVPFVDAWRYDNVYGRVYTTCYKLDASGNKVYVGDSGYDDIDAEVHICGYFYRSETNAYGKVTLTKGYLSEASYANCTPMPVTETVEGVISTDDIYPRTGDSVTAVSRYWKLFDSADSDTEELVFDDIDPSFAGQAFDPDSYLTARKAEDGKQTYYLQCYFRVKSGFFAEEFRQAYIMAGETLGLTFSSGRLNGMEFELMFLGAAGDVEAEYTSGDGTQWFELVANETYGTLLPSDTLYPEVGDEFVMYNWRAIDTTTGELTEAGQKMVTDAERELLAYAVEYLHDTMIDDGVYECTMNPSWVYDLTERSATVRANEYITRTFAAGQRVLLVDYAMFDTPRESRVIGFKVSLDMPYDHPVYKVGESVQYSRIGSVESKVSELTYNGRAYTGGSTAVSGSSGGTSSGGGTSVYIIKTGDSVAASDTNVYSALRSLQMFLRKDVEDTAVGPVTVEKRLTVQDVVNAIGRITGYEGIQLGPDYVSGLLGTGGLLDGKGYGEMRGLTLWEWLEVPELRYNRVSINTGIQWQTFGGGIIESVTVDTGDDGGELASGVIKLKLEDGEYGAVAEGDLCMGIYHDYGGDNDTEQEDQHNGNFRFKGFNTCYFRVDEVLDTERNSEFHYVLREPNGNWTQQHHPSEAMHFAAYANIEDTDRQRCIYSTTDYLIALYNMNDWEYGAGNIYYIRGVLDGFTMSGKTFSGTGIVIGNGYFYGTLEQFENLPLFMTVEIEDSDNFLAYGEDPKHIVCRVYKGIEAPDDESGVYNKTPMVTAWSVQRESGDTADDTVWNAAHTDFAGEIDIGYDDLGTNYNTLATLFRFTATLDDETAVARLTVG